MAIKTTPYQEDFMNRIDKARQRTRDRKVEFERRLLERKQRREMEDYDLSQAQRNMFQDNQAEQQRVMAAGESIARDAQMAQQEANQANQAEAPQASQPSSQPVNSVPTPTRVTTSNDITSVANNVDSQAFRDLNQFAAQVRPGDQGEPVGQPPTQGGLASLETARKQAQQGTPLTPGGSRTETEWSWNSILKGGPDRHTYKAPTEQQMVQDIMPLFVRRSMVEAGLEGANQAERDNLIKELDIQAVETYNDLTDAFEPESAAKIMTQAQNRAAIESAQLTSSFRAANNTTASRTALDLVKLGPTYIKELPVGISEPERHAFVKDYYGCAAVGDLGCATALIADTFSRYPMNTEKKNRAGAELEEIKLSDAVGTRNLLQSQPGGLGTVVRNKRGVGDLYVNYVVRQAGGLERQTVKDALEPDRITGMIDPNTYHAAVADMVSSSAKDRSNLLSTLTTEEKLGQRGLKAVQGLDDTGLAAFGHFMAQVNENGSDQIIRLPDHTAIREGLNQDRFFPARSREVSRREYHLAPFIIDGALERMFFTPEGLASMGMDPALAGDRTNAMNQYVINKHGGDLEATREFIQAVGNNVGTAAALLYMDENDSEYNAAMNIMMASGVAPGHISQGQDMVLGFKPMTPGGEVNDVSQIPRLTPEQRGGFLVGQQMYGFSIESADFINRVTKVTMEGLLDPETGQRPIGPQGIFPISGNYINGVSGEVVTEDYAREVYQRNLTGLVDRAAPVVEPATHTGVPDNMEEVITRPNVREQIRERNRKLTEGIPKVPRPGTQPGTIGRQTVTPTGGGGLSIPPNSVADQLIERRRRQQ